MHAITHSGISSIVAAITIVAIVAASLLSYFILTPPATGTDGTTFITTSTVYNATITNITSTHSPTLPPPAIEQCLPRPVESPEDVLNTIYGPLNPVFVAIPPAPANATEETILQTH